MKCLYKACSHTVHSCVRPQTPRTDLDLANQLAIRVVQAISRRGGFPDWASLTVGDETEATRWIGDGQATQAMQGT